MLTNDKDFGDLVFRDRLPHSGVILFRLGYMPIEARISAMTRILSDHSNQLDQFIVVTPQSIRVAVTPQPIADFSSFEASRTGDLER